MESAKDFGFNEGFLLDNGTEAPSNFTVIDSINDKSLAIPTDILATEHTNYSSALNGSVSIPADPNTFGKSFRVAKAVMNTVGLSKVPNTNDVKVGVDFRGDPIYSNPQLSNNKDASAGKKITDISGMALGAMGAFTDFKEASSYMAIGNKAADPTFHQELDSFKNVKDAKGFVSTIGKFGGSTTEFTAYKLYENWNNLSPAQKSLGIAGTGIQGFKFNDGNTFETKKLTPDIPGVPTMNAAEGLDLAGKGVNIAPATRHWNQLVTIQETLYSPKKASDVVFTANSQGLLGHGPDGRAVPVDENILGQSEAQLTPHYGVGAVTIPQGKGLPKGYVAIKNIGGRTVIIPDANKGTALIDAPDVASRSAANIYNNWNNTEVRAKQNNGVIGGSALVGGLHQMSASNPYSLGAVVTQTSFEHVGPKEQTNLQHATELVGISMQRLLKGEANKNVDSNGAQFTRDGEFTEQSFNKHMKEIRSEYAKNGISSKEIGYQLANQGFAEGRFNASQFTALQRSLDMAFDNDGFVTAQKLSTGKNKGFEILERRRG